MLGQWRMGAFVAELGRRNVFRVGVAYAAAAWLILQSADVLLELFGLPGWGVRMIAVVLLLGFPVALVLSWIYELTPEGLRADPGPDKADVPGNGTANKAPTAHRLDVAIAVALLAIAVLIVWENLVPAPDAGVEAAPVAESGREATIAVLPFADLSDTGDQRYFTDGLSEELLNALSTVDGLRVPSRTSIWLVNEKGLELREIAKQLRVEHVLEGAVRKAGDQLRITAQLVRASDGFRLWSESYDRDLDDVFAIQEDIANRILAELQVLVMGATPQVTFARPKIEAYELVARAREVRQYYAQEDVPHVEDLLRRAIAVDPAYAEAYFELATLLMSDANSSMAAGRRPFDAALAEAKPLLDHGFELDPDNAYGFARLGMYHTLLHDFEAAEDAYLRALKLQPNIDVFPHYGQLLEIQDRWAERLLFARQRASYNPRSYRARASLVSLLSKTGRIEEAATELDGLLEDFRDRSGMMGPQRELTDFLFATGEHARAVALYEKLLDEQRAHPGNGLGLGASQMVLLYFDAALRSPTPEAVWMAKGYLGDPHSGLEAVKAQLGAGETVDYGYIIAAMLGHLAGDYAFVVDTVFATWPSDSPSYPACRHSEFPHALIVQALRELERYSEAQALMSCWGDWLEVRRANGLADAAEWTRRGAYLAMNGESDAAFDAYEKALEAGFLRRFHGFSLHPQIQVLKGHDRYPAFVERYYALVNEQRRLLDLPPVAVGAWESL